MATRAEGEYFAGNVGHLGTSQRIAKNERILLQLNPVSPEPHTAPVVTHNIVYDKHSQDQRDDWLVDSGASVHLTNDMSLLQNITIFAEPRNCRLLRRGHRVQ